LWPSCWHESGALLVGERTNRARIRRIEKIIRDDPSVEDVGELLTMQLGPDQILLAVDVKFRRRRRAPGITIDRIEGRIRQQGFDEHSGNGRFLARVIRTELPRSAIVILSSNADKKFVEKPERLGFKFTSPSHKPVRLW